MYWGTPMFGNVTALEGLHVTVKYGTKHDAGGGSGLDAGAAIAGDPSDTCHARFLG